MQRSFKYIISFIIIFSLCIVLPFSSLAVDSSLNLEGGVMSQLMGLRDYYYTYYSYSRDGLDSILWQPCLGTKFEIFDVLGNKIYGNSSIVNLTKWHQADYYAYVEYRIPLMLGDYTYSSADSVSGNAQFCYNFHYLNRDIGHYFSFTDSFFVDSIFFKGRKYTDGSMSNYNFPVSFSTLPGVMTNNPLDDLDQWKFVNLNWSFDNDVSNGDVSSVFDYIDMDYLYIRVRKDMSSLTAYKEVSTNFGFTNISIYGDKQYQDNITISLCNLQTALDAMALMQAEKFDEMIALLQSIADKSQQEQVLNILQDLTTMSPDDPDAPVIDDLNSKADDLVGRQAEISDVLNSVPQPDINNITNIIKPSTVISNSDPATVQTALKVIYEWDTFIYIVTIVAALMVISYVIFGKKK